MVDRFAEFLEVDDKPKRLVPNQFPTIRTANRIAIVGEAPGADEEAAGKPFVGMSGRFLDQLLSKVGIVRAACFVGNVCQLRPPKNDIKHFDFDGPEITEGFTKLLADLNQFQPNITILLGKTALRAFKGMANLKDWRGTVFESTVSPGKCIASYHPAACLRQYDWTPTLTLDLARAARESHTPTINLPNRDLQTSLSYLATCSLLESILRDKPTVAADIEGGTKNVICISLATSPTHSFIVPFTHHDGTSFWTVDEEAHLWELVARIMADPAIKKVWQNGLYDRFVLQWTHDMIVCNSDDIMLMFWELYCEMENRLSYQVSILTDEPFYKMDRKTTDEQTFYRYCCRDSAVTLEIYQKLTKLLDEKARSHYSFNNAVLNPLLYAELRGIRYNDKLAAERFAEVESQIHVAQEKLNQIGRQMGVLKELNFASNESLLTQIQETCCYKRDSSTPKKAFAEFYYSYHTILQGQRPLTEMEKGEIASNLGASINTKSNKSFQDFLYNKCGLPPQYLKDPSTKEMRLTCNYEALLKLKKSNAHPVVDLALDLSRLRTRGQMLAMRSRGGRMHCSYKLVGSETGRVTCSKSNLYVRDGQVGGNLQTVPDDWDIEDEDSPLAQGMRDLYLADEGCYLGKCDLKGADGWTVGAYLAMLGDPTMLDDLRAGIKPAQIVAYILKHGATNIQCYANDREKLKELCSEIKKEDWEYFVSKQGIWGTCYTMGPRKLAERVFIESEGKVSLTEGQARDFQSAIYVRYRIRLCHDWMQRQINNSTYPFKLTASNGFTRKFYNRKSECLGEALAHLPQVYTTYATLRAAHRLWTDPNNRVVAVHEVPKDRVGLSGTEANNLRPCSCALRVEPLHQVHDELLVQFKIEDTAWAISKIKQWFANPIEIAGQQITIPFDGAYGTAWSMDKNHKVGDIK